ncbi:hypothetical protein HCN44_000413 [Aphidius gifuensis]|uniref:Uncharacterized protein n=1 Tax=Aphidius gifuensis TaxID=684658 RepID=A0A834XQ91_APHGI|nr:hypothetical protein HCN44_000413 [Aphidius gifuensis]
MSIWLLGEGLGWVTNSFRRYCIDNNTLLVDLHIALSDILNDDNVFGLFPYFMKHAKAIFLRVECMDDLKEISDSCKPANCYPLGKKKLREIIFYDDPTNRGETYSLQRFGKAESSLFCDLLKLLATEVFDTTNN